MDAPTLMGQPITLLFLYFVFYSFCGWLWETCYCSVKERHYVPRGFLYGPICPIYGVGFLLMVLFFAPFKDNLVVFYFVAVIVMTAWEYLVGWFLETTTHIKYWDYSDRPFNIKGRVCLEVSLFWGVMSYVAVFFIHPPVARLFARMPDWLQYTACGACLALLVTDTVTTIRKLALVTRALDRLHEPARAAQQGPPGGELLVLPSLQLGPLQLLNLVIQGVYPAGALRLVHLELVHLPADVVPLAVGLLIVLQQRLAPAELVQIAQVTGRVQELLPVVLAVDVQQLPPQLPQLGHRHQLSVDAAHVPAVPLELPLKEQLLLPGGEAVLLQPGQGGHPGKHRRHQGGLGPGADELPAGALPQHRADGVDDDGFARPRLAGEHVEPRLEPNVRRLDEGDIFNVKQGKQSCTPPLSRSL